MSRRALATVAAALIVGGIVFVVVGRGGSAHPATSAKPVATPPSASTTAVPATTGHGPALAAPGAPDPAASSSDETDPLGNSAAWPEPHVSPDLAARAIAIGGGTATPPTGTAIVRPGLHPAAEITAQRDKALAALATDAKDVEALRVVVSASCALNDAKTARKYNAALPPGDQAQMAAACHASGIALADDQAGKHWAAGTVPSAAEKQPPANKP